MGNTRRGLIALSLIVLVPLSAGADEGCGDGVTVDKFQYLRQLTLDLYSRVPSEDELTALIEREELSPADVAAMLQSEELETFLDRYHRDLLWPAIEPGDLVAGAFAFLLPAAFYGEYDGDPTRLFSLYPGLYVRGGLVPCADEPAEFDEEGQPILKPWPDGTMREGWVLVEPYWAPGTEVKVCALEAQMHPFAPNGAACDRIEGMATGLCGCGPELRHCLSPDSAVIVVESLRQQMLRMFSNTIREGRSYFDALTTKTEDLNGPLLHYYNYLVQMAIDPIVQVPPVLLSSLPHDVPFTDTTWKSYTRTPEHSGVLTSLSFLLRFQTSRARANRFYTAMLCAPFVAAAEAQLPSPNDPCSDEPDLRQRCGCNSCHAVLEPASAYWGRFADSGSLYLNTLQFPEYRADCAACASTPGQPCDFICERFYLTEPGHPKEDAWVGKLKGYVFRDAGEVESVIEGPKGLVQKRLDDGSLASCAVRRVFSQMHRQEMSAAEIKDVLPALVERFESTGYDFRDLLLAVVSLPTYRRLLR